MVSDPPQGNAIATIVNRNPVEPQPVVHVAPQLQTHQKLQQAQNLMNRVSIQQQQFRHDGQAPQPPVTPASVGGMWQARGKKGRGAVRGGGAGRGQHGAVNQPQQLTVPAPQQEVKIVPTTKVQLLSGCCV
jgi:hypothetical protein